MGKPRVGLMVTATALVLASCVARTGGSAERAPADGSPVTLGSSAPDAEVDPCSLTGPAAYEPHGTARMPGRPDLDNCRVSVATDEGRAHVWVGEQLTTEDLPGDRTELADLGRGATIERYGNGCDTALVYDGHFVITAKAVPADDEEQPSEGLLCELTQGAAKGVFNVLAGDRVKFWRPPSNSLATLTLCEVLPRALVAGRLGVPSVEPVHPPAGHRCRWGDEDGSHATLRIPIAESPADLGLPGTPTETIAGRESWVITATEGFCAVYTKHIEFELGVGTFEYAELTVTTPTDPCAAARTLATSAWQHLPKPA